MTRRLTDDERAARKAAADARWAADHARWTRARVLYDVARSLDVNPRDLVQIEKWEKERQRWQEKLAQKPAA